MKSVRALSVAVLAAGALLLSACGTGGTAAQSGSSTGSLNIVTSTNVYADIVKNVGGDAVSVTPIIDDPSKDPHDYEATTLDQLKLSKADMVVQNGGGYDSFITTMLEAVDAKPVIVDAVEISGLPGSDGVKNEPHEHGNEGHQDEGGAEGKGGDDLGEGHEHDEGEENGHEGHDHGEFNEHVWYSVSTMIKVVDAVEAALEDKLPDQASAIEANAAGYRGKLEDLNDTIAAAREANTGKKAAATEPVPLWLFEDLGLEPVTPPEFLEAVEEGNDVPPLVLKQAQDQIANKDVDILGYNTQATNEQAQLLKQAAEEAGIPVVDLAETMPEDTHYIDWMSNYVDEIGRALG